MKKIIIGIICCFTLNSAATLQTKNLKLITNSIVYLIEDVQYLKKENAHLKSQIKQLQNQVNEKKYYDRDYQKTIKHTNTKIKQNYKNLYKIKSNIPAYDNNFLKGKAKRVYKQNDIVKIVQETKKAAKTQSGYWLNKKNLKKINTSKNVFYKIETYMANVRTSANADNRDNNSKSFKKK